MKDFKADVVDIRLESRTGLKQRWQMLLSETAFSATKNQGRLEAVAPSGARLDVPVLGVLIDGNEVWHLVDKPLTAGTLVTGYVFDAALDPG